MVKLKELLIFFLIFSFLFFLGCVSGNDAGVDNNLDFDNGEKLNPVTQDCISWFDGCNYCSLDDSGLIFCTERACVDEPLKEPYCISYNSFINELYPEGCPIASVPPCDVEVTAILDEFGCLMPVCPTDLN